MKKILLSLLVLIAMQASAQYKHYRDSTYAMPFNYLSGATSANNGQWWDDDTFVVPLGFNFRLFNDSVNQVTIWGSGAIVSTSPDPDNANFITGIVAHGSDLLDRDTTANNSFSPISYTTSGVAPNRIFKLEWRNAGFYNAVSNGNYSDSVTFQLWLYETKHFAELHYGNGNYISPNLDLYDGGPGAWFGIFDSLDANSPNADCRVMYSFAGNLNAPHLDSLFNLNFNAPPGVNGNPVAGTVYRFIPKTGTGGGATSYQTLITQVNYNIDYYSHHQQLRIDIFSKDHFQYILTDINGRLIKNGKISQGRTTIPTEDLPAGMYVIKLFSEKENTSFKFIR